jgi:type VI protein secretion system component Hcp
MNKKPLITLALAAAAAVFATAPAHAASDFFMKLEPAKGGQPIRGESKDPAFPGAIEISSFAWSADNPVNITSTSGGAGNGKAKLEELKVKKVVDSTTPVMFQHLAEGRHFQGLELTVRNAALTTRYYFQNVFIKSQEQSGDTGDEAPTETLTFQYGAVAQLAAAPGQKKPIANAFGSWNQVANIAALTDLPVGFK